MYFRSRLLLSSWDASERFRRGVDSVNSERATDHYSSECARGRSAVRRSAASGHCKGAGSLGTS